MDQLVQSFQHQLMSQKVEYKIIQQLLLLSSALLNQKGGGGGKTTTTLVSWTIPTVLEIGKREGLVGLYRGFVPKLLRLGPGGGLLLVTFEKTKQFIEDTQINKCKV